MSEEIQLSEEQKTNLQLKADEALAIREMCQSRGFKLLRESFEEKVEKATKQFLSPEIPVEDLLKLRAKALLWTEISHELKTFMLRGDQASSLLASSQETAPTL